MQPKAQTMETKKIWRQQLRVSSGGRLSGLTREKKPSHIHQSSWARNYANANMHQCHYTCLGFVRSWLWSFCVVCVVPFVFVCLCAYGEVLLFFCYLFLLMCPRFINEYENSQRVSAGRTTKATLHDSTLSSIHHDETITAMEKSDGSIIIEK